MGEDAVFKCIRHLCVFRAVRRTIQLYGTDKFAYVIANREINMPRFYPPPVLPMFFIVLD